MRATISSEVLDAIIRESRESPTREVCGLLFGSSSRIVGHRSCRNVAADPATTFEIDPRALIAAHKAARAGGPPLVGSYHSHPLGPASPSARDAAAAPADGAFWLIVGSGGAGLWRAVARGACHGRFDPVELVADSCACTAP